MFSLRALTRNLRILSNKNKNLIGFTLFKKKLHREPKKQNFKSLSAKSYHIYLIKTLYLCGCHFNLNFKYLL